ncbi:MAG: sensor domain-containing diguanylate cyclase [Treponema sp.]|jgi:diguanylate cyclase (GGDEF)-like protein|nr:sensor domain-containing diguanylate cyclase [Treponema sp.]
MDKKIAADHYPPGRDSNPGEDQEKDFFIRIFRQLGACQDPYQSISGILKDTCDFFGFYSGFVYEADHTRVFRLCEHFQGQNLRNEFSLLDYLSCGEIEALVRQTGEIVYLNSRKNEMGSKFLELFSGPGGAAQTLVMVPVIFENQFPIAFVGLMDRRRPIRLSKKEINDADAVLSVLAGHIKTRVYRKHLEYAHESMKNIVNNAGLDIYVSDYRTGEIIFANESMAGRHGGMEKVLGKNCRELLAGDEGGTGEQCLQEKTPDEEGRPPKVYVRDYQSSTGNWYRALTAVFRWTDGRLARVVSSIDITENRRNEDLIRKMAENDTLTSLPNRRKFVADLEESLVRMRKNGKTGYLLFMDLDDFKGINDTLGHLAGDKLLCTIADFLQGARDTLGIPYRYGGDEFVILAENRGPEDLNCIRSTLLDRFDAEWQLGERAVPCKISIGAVVIPDRETPSEVLVRAADIAMYEVKRSGKHGFRMVNRASEEAV